MIIALYGSIFNGVGFVSDDHNLLFFSENSPLFQPLENHHFSLFLNFLFKFTPTGSFAPKLFHLLAFIFHFFNCLLVFFLLKECFAFNKIPSALVSMLFAINPAGTEVIIWCCTLPYVVLTTFTLLSLILLCTELRKEETERVTHTAICLAFLQILGFLVWDWAVLILPILLITAFFYPSRLSLSKKLTLILPTAAAWIFLLCIKKMGGYSIGYRFNAPLLSAKIFLSSPFLAIFPLGTKTFYNSPLAITSAIVTFIAFTFSAIKDRRATLFFAIFLLCQIPPALFGYSQSRYFYLPSFALFSLLVLFMQQGWHVVSTRWIPLCGFGLLLIGYSLFVYARVCLWVEADQIANQIRKQVEEVAYNETAPIIIVDIPYWHGPEGMIWKPHLWRSGRNYFHGKATCVITENHPDSLSDPFQKRWEMHHLFENFPEKPIYRFEYPSTSDGYTLKKIQ